MDQTAKIKILCVEDEKDLRENIALMLREEGYETIEAANGQEAYEKFSLYRPNVVLCDINMPVLNGYELLKKIHSSSNQDYREVPFLFLTAWGQNRDYLKGLELGADEYIIKPVDFEILLSTIKSKLTKVAEHKIVTQAKLEQICDQISHLLPEEIRYPLKNIITLSATLKKDIGNLNIDKRYLDYIGRIYLSSLKLNSQIIKAFDKERIIKEVNNLSNYVAVEQLVSKIKQQVTNKNVIFKLQEKLPHIAIDSASFIAATVHYIEQHELARSQDLNIDVFQDYLNNLILSIACKASLPVFSGELEKVIKECGGDFHIQDNDGITYHIITFPSYILK